MAGVDLRLNRAEMNRMLEGRSGPVTLYVANYGREVQGAAKRLVPVVSGRLKSSIRSRLVRTGRGWGVEVGSEEPYASWIEDGKRRDPRSGRVIRVKVGPRPFMRRAVNETGFGLSRRRRLS